MTFNPVCVCPESTDKFMDADQSQMLTTSQHELGESDRNNNSTGSVKKEIKGKKVQWKQQTSGKD